MVPPGRRAPIAESAHLCSATRRGRIRIVEDRGSPAQPVEWIEIFRDFPAIFAQSREIAAKDGNLER
jgi:hypothetical protein